MFKLVLIIVLLSKTSGIDRGNEDYTNYTRGEICISLYLVGAMDKADIEKWATYFSHEIRKELEWEVPDLSNYGDPDYEKNLPRDVFRRYDNFLSSLNFLLTINKKNDIIKKGIEKLLSEQGRGGSWVRVIYFTSKSIGILNKYYTINPDNRVLKAITKANIWLLNRISGLQYDPHIIDLCSFALANLPEEEEEKRATNVKQRLKQEWLNNDEISLFYPSHYETCLYLLQDNSVTNIEKERLAEEIANIILEENFWKERKSDPVDIALAIRLLNACKKYLAPERQSDVEDFISKSVLYLKKQIGDRENE